MQSDPSIPKEKRPELRDAKYIRRVRKRYNQLCEADTEFHGGRNIGPQVDDEERVTYLFLQGGTMRDADMCIKRPHMLQIGAHDREPGKETALHDGSPPGTDQALPGAVAEEPEPSGAVDAEEQSSRPSDLHQLPLGMKSLLPASPRTRTVTTVAVGMPRALQNL